MPEERFEVHVLAPGPLVAVVPLTVERAPDERLLSHAIRTAGAALGGIGPALEQFVVPPESDAAGPVPILLVVESMASNAPAGPAAAARFPPSLRARAAEWLAGGWEAPPPLRAPWSRPGWFDAAAGWMRDTLEAIGRPLTGPVEQRQIWSISSLLRAPTEHGRVYLKGCFSIWPHEPRISRSLAETFPGRVPVVLATEEQRGWLLLDDFGDRAVRHAGTPEEARETIRRHVAMQRAMTDRTDDLLAAGAPHRPLERLADDLARVLPDQADLIDARLPADRSRALVDGVGERARWLGSVGSPETLVHGDFHRGNVALADTGPLVFDWSDIAVGHPLMDVATWSDDDEPGSFERDRADWLDAWSGAVDASTLAARWDDVVALGAAHQIVSYAGILASVEPSWRPDLQWDSRGFVSLLDRLAGPASARAKGRS